MSKAAFSYFAPLVNGELRVRYYFLDAATTIATAPSTHVADGNSTVSTHQTSSRTAPASPVATDVKPTVKPTPTAGDNEASAAASSKSAAAAAASSKSAQAAKAQASADAAAAKQAQAEAAAAAEAQKQKEAAAEKEQEAQAAAAAAAKQKQQEQAAAAAAAAAAQKQKEQEQAAAAAAAASKAAAEAAQAQATQSSGGGGGGKVFTGGFATYFLVSVDLKKRVLECLRGLIPWTLTRRSLTIPYVCLCSKTVSPVTVERSHKSLTRSSPCPPQHMPEDPTAAQ